jgi:class 3 adenylate cyclase/tetratricopeptide (TPR) repeat protein
VLCPSCGRDNREDASFCKGCGAKLARACPSCAADLEADASFCGKCGHRLAEPSKPTAAPDPLAYTPRHLAEKILRDRAALEGERRTVTVLFADAMGFTPISERLDEEQVYDLMQGCLARMMDAVHRYEGTITQFTGDGVMALFGAPIAHEDSARRAVAAALEMQKSLDNYAAEVKNRHAVECRFRVGLNTGPVVVGKISDNLDMDYTALGDAVNLAARMEQLAEPGTVQLSENTYRAVQGYFECEPLGALTVKGKAAPVLAYKALRERPVRTRFEAAVERGLTPFVGRDQELAALRGYLEQAKRGQGQVVFVSGEAGIGKSRLLLEFRRCILDEVVTWLEGHCISYSKNVPYLPMIDILKSNFGVQEADNDAAIIRKVDESTAEWVESARATVPYLKYLLNIDPGDPAVLTMDPMERRAGIFAGLRALLLQDSQQRLLVVVVEDLQWIDEKSEEALAVLVDVIASAPVLLILTHRPDYAHSLGERTHYSRLTLSNLPSEESVAMAERVLQVAALPQQIQQLITTKAEGNPFYIEEITKSLVESGVLRRTNGAYSLERPADQIRIPDTIQEVILSRIDRLEREAKEAIQLASVIGREFTVRLLNRISHVEAKLDGLLAELKSLEIIYEKAHFPELSYMFKHALTHDVAYSTLLLKQRKALHRIVAVAIEELYTDRLPEHYEALAHHYHQGQEWQKALHYLVKAAQKAAAAYANQDAVDHYARALEVCEKLGDLALGQSVAIAQSRAFVNFTIGDFPSAAADCGRILAAARSLGSRRLEGMALALRGMSELRDHDFETAEETLKATLAVGDEGFDDVRFFASLMLSGMFAAINRHAEAGPLMQMAEGLVPKVDNAFGQASWGNWKGLAINLAGRFDEALQHLERWRSAAEASLNTLVGNRWTEALARAGKGEYQQALDVLKDVLATCERTGEVLFQSRALNTIGWIYAELQDHQRAMEWNTRGVEAAVEAHFSDAERESNARLNLGDNLLALGRSDEAEEQFQKVEQVVRNPRPQDRWMLWRYSQHLFHSYGELWLARGDCDKALAYADECLALAEQSDSRKNIVKGRRLRGQVLLAQGKLPEAEKELATALEIAQEVGNPPQVWKTHATVGDLRKTQRRGNDARQAYRDALAVIEGVATGLSDESLRETFLSSDHVQGIRRAAEVSE